MRSLLWISLCSALAIGLQPRFLRIAEECGKTAEFIAKVPPGVGKVLSTTAVPLSAIASSAVPVDLVAKGVGAVFGGGLARVGVAPVLVESRYKALQYKIANLLAGSDLEDPSLKEQVTKITKSWKLPSDHSSALLTQIYAKFLQDLLLNDNELTTRDMADSVALLDVLDLTSAAAGDAFFEVAVAVYRELQWTDTETLEDPNSNEYLRISKLFFLVKRVISSVAKGSDEEVQFEMNRIRSVFSLDESNISLRCDELAAPIYDQALQGARLVDGQMLEKLRDSLGLSVKRANEMHLLAFQTELAKENRGDMEELGAILGLSDAEKEQAAAGLTREKFEASLDDSLKQILFEDKEVQVASLKETMAQNWIPAETALVLVSQAYEKVLLQAFPRFQDDVSQVLTKHRAVLALGLALAPSTTSTEPIDAIFRTTYRNVFSTAQIGDNIREVLSQGDRSNAESLGRLLEIDADALNVLVKQVLMSKLEAAASSNQKPDLNNVDFPPDLVKDCGLAVYEQQLQKLGKNKIPSASEKEALDSTQKVLSLTEAEVSGLLATQYSTIFQSSAAEAMSQCLNATLRDEYATKLEQLGERLGLNLETQKKALESAASLVLEAALHRAKLNSRTEKSDTDDDDVSIGIQALEGKGSSGSGSTLAFLTQIATAVQLYTANNMEALHDPKTNHLCRTMAPAERGTIYQSFVLSSLWLELNPNTDFPQNAVTGVALKLPQVLGLTSEATAKLRRNVGLQLVFRLCEAALPKNNGALDSAEAALIAKLESALDADLSEAVVGAKKKLLIRGLEAAASTPGASIADMRNLAVSMGLDVAGNELGLSSDSLQFYFKTEARQLITDFFSSALTEEAIDIADALNELAEAYELETSLLEPILKQMSADQLDLAQAEFKAGNAHIAATHLLSIASCIDFVGNSLDLLPHLWLTSTDRKSLFATLTSSASDEPELVNHIQALFDAKNKK